MALKVTGERGPRSLVDVVADGDRRATLVALRDYLARVIEEGSMCRGCGTAVSVAVAPLVGRLTDVLRELEAISPPKEDSILDRTLKDRARRQAAEIPKRPASSD